MLTEPGDLGGCPAADLAEAILAERLQGGFVLGPDPGDELEVVARPRGRRCDRCRLVARIRRRRSGHRNRRCRRGRGRWPRGWSAHAAARYSATRYGATDRRAT